MVVCSRLTPEIESSLDRESKSGCRESVLRPYSFSADSPALRFWQVFRQEFSRLLPRLLPPFPACCRLLDSPTSMSPLQLIRGHGPKAVRTKSGEDDAERGQCPSLPTAFHIPKAGMRQMCEGARAAARVHAYPYYGWLRAVI